MNLRESNLSRVVGNATQEEMLETCVRLPRTPASAARTCFVSPHFVEESDKSLRPPLEACASRSALWSLPGFIILSLAPDGKYIGTRGGLA